MKIFGTFFSKFQGSSLWNGKHGYWLALSSHIHAFYLSTGLRRLFALLLVLVLFTGCASVSGVKVGERGVNGQEAHGVAVSSIEKIYLIKGKDADRVEIIASQPITYTAFRLSNPSRLVIDIPDVFFKEVDTPISVNDGLIGKINSRLYQEKSKNIGRVEIEIGEDTGYDLQLKQNTLSVNIKKEEAENELAGLAEEMRSVQDIVSPGTEEIAGDIGKTGEDKDGQEGAKNILSVDVARKHAYEVVKIRGDGRIGSFHAYTLDKPRRLLLDLWGVKSRLKEKEISVDSPLLQRILLNEDPDRLQFAIEVKGDSLPPYWVTKSGDTITIVFGGQKIPIGLPEVMEAKTETQQEQSGLIEEKVRVADIKENKHSLAEIKAIEIEDKKGVFLILIKTSRTVDYKLSRSQDGKTLGIVLKDALLSQDLQRTIDTSEFNSPVESVSSFQQTQGFKEVVMVLRLKEKVLPEIDRKTNLITLRFSKKASATIQAHRGRLTEMPPVKTREKAEKKKPDSGVEKTRVRKIEELTISKERDTFKRYTGRKISIDVQDADIKNIFRLIAEVSNLNVVVAEEVKGKITLRLINVPWDQALDMILKTKGLGMIREGNVLRIAPSSKIAEEKKAAVAQKKAQEELEGLVVRLIPINYATASDLMSKVKNLLSDRGSVTVDERTNTMIIKDVQANIDDAVSLIRRLDTPTPQVLIEARIVEAEDTFARDLGIEWGVAGGLSGTDEQAALFGGLTGGLTPPTNLGLSSSMGSQNFAVSLPASGSAGQLGSLGFAFGKLTGDPMLLDLRLSAGETKGLSKVISRPRIITLDNKEAKISQGDSVPFETVSQNGTQTQFIDAALDLVVTPHITPDGSVVMKMKVSRNSIGTFRSATGTPSISKKEASTEIIIEDGDTAVIGGIISTDRSDNTAGVPGLYKVPVLGWLFKRKSNTNTQRELLIFITPRILKK